MSEPSSGLPRSEDLAPRLPLRPPKWVASDPRGAGLAEALAAHTAPLSDLSTARALTGGWTPDVAAALEAARDAGHLERGLEAAERKLIAEERGLTLTDQTASTPRRPRLSRLLVLTNDGAPRFYRNVATLLDRYGSRLAAIRLDVESAQLGALLFGEGSQARLVMLEHKLAVGAFLLALAPQYGAATPAAEAPPTNVDSEPLGPI